MGMAHAVPIKVSQASREVEVCEKTRPPITAPHNAPKAHGTSAYRRRLGTTVAVRLAARMKQTRMSPQMRTSRRAPKTAAARSPRVRPARRSPGSSIRSAAPGPPSTGEYRSNVGGRFVQPLRISRDMSLLEESRPRISTFKPTDALPVLTRHCKAAVNADASLSVTVIIPRRSVPPPPLCGRGYAPVAGTADAPATQVHRTRPAS